jgi:hypothetical protein
MACFTLDYVRGFPWRRWAQILALKPRVIDEAPVPFESSVRTWVTVPVGDTITLSLQ